MLLSLYMLMSGFMCLHTSLQFVYLCLSGCVVLTVLVGECLVFMWVLHDNVYMISWYNRCNTKYIYNVDQRHWYQPHEDNQWGCLHEVDTRDPPNEQLCSAVSDGVADWFKYWWLLTQGQNIQVDNSNESIILSSV